MKLYLPAADRRALLRGESVVRTPLVTRFTSTVDGWDADAAQWARLDFNDVHVESGPCLAGLPGYFLKIARPDTDTRHRVRPRLPRSRVVEVVGVGRCRVGCTGVVRGVDTALRWMLELSPLGGLR